MNKPPAVIPYADTSLQRGAVVERCEKSLRVILPPPRFRDLSIFTKFIAVQVSVGLLALGWQYRRDPARLDQWIPALLILSFILFLLAWYLLLKLISKTVLEVN